MTPSPEMIRRVAAAQGTLDRFKDRPLRFGMNDCARMTASHLRRLGCNVKLPAAGAYRSRRKALELLASQGFTGLADALDALGLERISPAAAVVADIVQLPSADALGSLTIVLGNGRVFGWHEHVAGAVVMQPKLPIAAWRAPL